MKRVLFLSASLVMLMLSSCDNQYCLVCGDHGGSSYHNSPGYFYISKCEQSGSNIVLEWTSSDYANYYSVEYEGPDEYSYSVVSYSVYGTSYTYYYPDDGFCMFRVTAHNDYGEYSATNSCTYSSGSSGGGGGSSGGGGGTTTEEWVKVRATGYTPYWYCPTDGTTIPSVKRTDNDIRAYKNSYTGAYKVNWAGKEYTAHYGYNRITMDTEYHSVYNSSYGGYWTSCCDYYYYEFTIYE